MYLGATNGRNLLEGGGVPERQLPGCAMDFRVVSWEYDQDTTGRRQSHDSVN